MLESEIVKLREAVEALTAALEKNPVAAASTPTVKEVPKNQDEPPKNQDGVTIDTIKDAALKASRAGHKATIRAKLAELGASKLQDISPEHSVVFYNWLNTLEAK
jgi:hypothetical protein